MRRFAGDALAAANVELEFRAPLADGDVPLDPEVRRELLLIVKEAVSNITRHARARHARVELAVAGGTLHLLVGDDGRGFEAAGASAGNGLASMRRRAARIGASLVIASHPGAGTSIEVTLPGRRTR